MAISYKLAASLILPLLAALKPSAAQPSDPPQQLVQENIEKASVIAAGEIVSTENPRPGVTLAHFKTQECYRGPCKQDQELVYASFREGDKYDPQLLHTKLIVFLRKRKPEFAPPSLETATDLSEFPYSDTLKAQVVRKKRPHQ